jgi:hypothetical protein
MMSLPLPAVLVRPKSIEVVTWRARACPDKTAFPQAETLSAFLTAHFLHANR